MSLFKNKKEKIKNHCLSEKDANNYKDNENILFKPRSIKILGGGCSKCHSLEENLKMALDELGLDIDIEFVSDFNKIAAFGVMTTPAMVIDEKVVSFGKVLKKEEIILLLKENA